MNFMTAKTLSGDVAGSLGISAKAEDTIGIRPEHFRTTTAAKALISATLELVENLGEYALVHMLTEAGDEIIVKMDTPPKQAAGETIHLTTDKASIHQFDGNTGKRLA